MNLWLDISKESSASLYAGRHKQDASLNCVGVEKGTAVMEGGRRGPGHSGGLWRLDAQNSCLQHSSGMSGGPTVSASSTDVLSPSLLYRTQPKSSSKEERGDDGLKSEEREEEMRPSHEQ